MKTVVCLGIACLWNWLATGQTNVVLTNNVAISKTGVFFSISDEPYSAQFLTNAFSDTLVFADARMVWILHNATNKNVSLRNDRMRRTFELRLFDLTRHEIPLTEYGKYMSA